MMVEPLALSVFLVLVSALVVAGCCIYLSLHGQYKSGVIGSVGLALLGLGAASRVFKLSAVCWREGCDQAWLSPEAVFVWFGLAFFFGQCVFRFQRRLRARRRGGPWYA